jgi:thiol-disulfide isomerase/thioredoxin
MDVICPKFGHRQEASDECLRCGVLFVKASHHEPAAGGGPPAPVRRASPPVLAWLAPVLVLALLWAWIGRRPPAPGAGALAEAPPIEAPEAGPPDGHSPSDERAESETPAEVEASGLPDPAAEDPAAWTEPPPEWEPAPEPAEPPSGGFARPPIVNYDWHRGAAGFSRAYEEARETGQPVLVYFYTDWCSYCRELDRELLADARVADYTCELIKVRINPERGAAEREIAIRYGVAGYPSLFVHGRGLGEPRKVRRQVREGGDWRLRTPAEFVATLRAAAG